jgi:hypothetical protein
VPFVFKLMCWGFWSNRCSYNNKPYDIKLLLQDSSPGAKWVIEPYTTASAECNGLVSVIGCILTLVQINMQFDCGTPKKICIKEMYNF